MFSNCLNCKSEKYREPVLNLGLSPLANCYADDEWSARNEELFPLSVSRCQDCDLIQLDQRVDPDKLFSSYSFRQGQSQTWREHLQRYAEEMKEKLSLTRETPVADVASNDGTLLRVWERLDVRAVGIEPFPLQDEEEKPTEVWADYLGISSAIRMLAAGVGPFNLMTINNCLAHVPSLDDFLGGARLLLKEDGVITVECPDWDRASAYQLYHEHIYQFTRNTLTDVLERRGFRVDDMVSLPTHEGSWRAICSRV